MTMPHRCPHRVLLVSRLKGEAKKIAEEFLRGRQTGETQTNKGLTFYRLSFQCVHIEGHFGTHRDTLDYQWGTPEEYDEERETASRTSDRAGTAPDRDGC